MNTRELSESLVQELYDMACDGDVAEVLILARTASGALVCAYATDDMHRMVDESRAVLADVETDDGAHSRRLN